MPRYDVRLIAKDTMTVTVFAKDAKGAKQAAQKTAFDKGVARPRWKATRAVAINHEPTVPTEFDKALGNLDPGRF